MHAKPKRNFGVQTASLARVDFAAGATTGERGIGTLKTAETASNLDRASQTTPAWLLLILDDLAIYCENNDLPQASVALRYLKADLLVEMRGTFKG